MVGESLFGTIRFGESPETAVSPVLLSGTSAVVSAVGASGSAVRIGKELSAGQETPSSGRAHVLRTGGIRSPDSREGFSSGSAVGAGRNLGAWNDTPGTCHTEAEIGRSPASSQGTIPWAAIRPERTAATTSEGGPLTASSGAAIASLRELRGTENREEVDGIVLPDVFRLLASGQGIKTIGEIRVGSAAILAGDSHASTASTIALPFPGLVAWILQEGTGTAIAEIERPLASDTPTTPGIIRTSLHVPTALCCTSWSWVHAMGSVQGAGLLILNRQGALSLTRLRAERRTGSNGTGRINIRNGTIRVARIPRQKAPTNASARARMPGTGIAGTAVQCGFPQGYIPLRRNPAGRTGSVGMGSTVLKATRRLEGRHEEQALALLSPLLLRDVAGSTLQEVTETTLLGRIRTLGSFDREAFLTFSRFAVVPDLRNDRVVVVFAEVRSVVIPRQSDL